MVRVSALIAGVAGFLMLCGCGSGSDINPSVQAELYAEQACRSRPVEPGGVATVTDKYQILEKYRQSASFAAKAAELDIQWDRLNLAYSTLVDVWNFIASLPGQPSIITPEQRVEGQRFAVEEIEAEATVRAECRKTD